VILLPLTLLASVFGMNVRVPGEGDMAAFWLILVIMLVLGAGLIALFRWRRWF
jgi:magnesium transporter